MRTLLLALVLVACRVDDGPGTEVVDHDGDGVPAELDCNDEDETAYPDAPEMCDGVDNDCDGDIDEDAEDATPFYADLDGDGYGDPDSAVRACDAPDDHVPNADDCDDGDDATHPGAEEVCTDPVDRNCDGSVGYADADGDGFAACEDCDDTREDVNPDAPEVCDGVDNDCDGESDEAGAEGEGTFYADADLDGYGDPSDAITACDQPEGRVEDGTDCDDSRGSVNPGAVEVCNDRDDDCDDEVDEAGAEGEQTFYADEDGDGYGDPDVTRVACDQPEGFVTRDGDCNDDDDGFNPGVIEECTDPEDRNCDGSVGYADDDGDGFAACEECDDTRADVNPDAEEICNGIDDDCDKEIDEGVTTTFFADGDGDGFGVEGETTEACALPARHAEVAGDCDDSRDEVNPDAAEVCNERDDDCDGDTDEDVTTTFYADADGDAYGVEGETTEACVVPEGYAEVFGDCDDESASVNPGAEEVCNEFDDDCDGATDEGVTTTFYVDADGDAYGLLGEPREACALTDGLAAEPGDCDDTNGSVNPGAEEVCNEVDDDCDGATDEGVTTTFYADADGDLFGVEGRTTEACDVPEGYAKDFGDCDDGNRSIFPGAEEVCNGVDDDCNEKVDEGVTTTFYVDADGDSYGVEGETTEACAVPEGFAKVSGDCDDGEQAVNPGATEVCNERDDDCDGGIDEGVTTTFYVDGDGDAYGLTDQPKQACALTDGLAAEPGDCDDTAASVNPGATEVCNEVDDDCDGATDEGVTTTFYADADGDLFGVEGRTTEACDVPEGYAKDFGDCDDGNRSIFPGAEEVCNGVDDDCDEKVDEGVTKTFYVDLDGDQYGTSDTAQACEPTDGLATEPGDCDDTNGSVNPGAEEVCNGVDDDCDLDTDEGVTKTFYVDEDGDAYGLVEQPKQACALTDGLAAEPGDCDDTNDRINPSAEEVCNGRDDDCDGKADEGVTTTFYADADRDSYGVEGETTEACVVPEGFAKAPGDCDDKDADVNPGATEVCNERDDDCDGGIDEGVTTTFYVDGDGDAYGHEPVEACALSDGLSSSSGDCDDTNPKTHPGAPEACTGDDNDCNGVVDDNEAWRERSCAAESCLAIRDNWDGRAPSGLFHVAPGGAPFEAYCDQETDGGGWTLVWKNHGGDIGGEWSNADLLEKGQGAGVVLPYEDELISEVNRAAWDHYRVQPNREWVKIGSLWDREGRTVVDRQTIRVDMGKVTMAEIFSVEGNRCAVASDTMRVYAYDRFIGQTNLINAYSARATYGLANSGNGGEDHCDQPEDNLVYDGSDLYRLDSGDGLNTIRHLFSYRHTAAGQDASRCHFACWNAELHAGYHDAFVWGVR